jgi:flagellar hook assembly protein FlgD
VTSAGEDEPSGLPTRITLSQNYPNPFNPTTTINYSLPVRSEVVLEVFNVLGQRVRILVNQEQPAGTYAVEWDGTSESGDPVATGIYLYRLRTEQAHASKKMLLIK